MSKDLFPVQQQRMEARYQALAKAGLTVDQLARQAGTRYVRGRKVGYHKAYVLRVLRYGGASYVMATHLSRVLQFRMDLFLSATSKGLGQAMA